MIRREKTWTSRVAAAVATAAFLGGAGVTSVGAQAGDSQMIAPPGNDAKLRDTPGVEAAEPMLIPGSKDVLDGDLGEHQVTGTVSSIDKDSGTMSIDVKGKDMKILFPASSLAKVERGDEVTVAVSVHKVPAAQTR